MSGTAQEDGRWQRLFDLPERHLPDHLHTDTLTDDACLTTLLTHAGRALGTATTSDLADYLRIPTRHATRLLPHTPLLPTVIPHWPPNTWTYPDALNPPPPPPRAGPVPRPLRQPGLEPAPHAAPLRLHPRLRGLQTR
ncbi:DNA glycosylase AlkZ-like family protein [Streptomyces sp. NBUA17]|uniref:DNA glycosylase AlkZ-like family protein n=1 Tax=Streptomyces sp. NBUA17 TaxID=3062275 RepID=UPI0037DA7238